MGKWEFPTHVGTWTKEPSLLSNRCTRRMWRNVSRNDILSSPLVTRKPRIRRTFYGDTYLLPDARGGQRDRLYGSPPIAYGSSRLHLGQLGNVLSRMMYYRLPEGRDSGFWNAGFRKQILFSLHGQEYLVPSAINELAKKYQVPAVLLYLDVPRVMEHH